MKNIYSICNLKIDTKLGIFTISELMQRGKMKVFAIIFTKLKNSHIYGSDENRNHAVF